MFYFEQEIYKDNCNCTIVVYCTLREICKQNRYICLHLKCAEVYRRNLNIYVVLLFKNFVYVPPRNCSTILVNKVVAVPRFPDLVYFEERCKLSINL